MENLLAQALEMQTKIDTAKSNDTQRIQQLKNMGLLTEKYISNQFANMGLKGVYAFIGNMSGASAPIIISDPAIGKIAQKYTIGHIECPWEEHTIYTKKYTEYKEPHFVIYKPHSTIEKVSYGNDINAFLKGCDDAIREILFRHLEATK